MLLQLHQPLTNMHTPRQNSTPLGIKSQNLQTDVSAVFSLLSLGFATNRGTWVYSFDREQLNRRMQEMTAYYEQRRQQVSNGGISVGQASRNDTPTQIYWTAGLRNKVRCTIEIAHDPNNSRIGKYRSYY